MLAPSSDDGVVVVDDRFRGGHPVRGVLKKLQDALFNSLYVMCIVDRLYITQQITPDTLTGHMQTSAVLAIFACAVDRTGERCEHLCEAKLRPVLTLPARENAPVHLVSESYC